MAGDRLVDLVPPKDQFESLCVACEEVEGDASVGVFICRPCAKRYPPSLIKACYDYFDYALGLTDGRVIEFCQASIHGDWVNLTGKQSINRDETGFRPEEFPYPCPRGVDIRLADIAWCADAPEGS